MRQQVGDNELGLVRIAADHHIDDLAVFQRNGAVKLKGNGDPLIFFNAAVVVRLEVAHLILLIQRDLLEVDAGGIDVCAGDNGAFSQALFADHSQQQRLAAVVAVDLHAGLELHAEMILDKAVLLRQGNGVDNRLALHARTVQVIHVALAVVLNCEALLGVDQIIAVFLLIKKIASQFIHGA